MACFNTGILRALSRKKMPFNMNSFLSSQNPCFISVATYRTKYPPEPPPSFSDVEMPEARELPDMQRIPHYYINTKPPLLRKSHTLDLRGPEKVNNELLYKQYGIIALSAGYITYQHAEIIVNTINREMDKKRTFAIWRVDPLWKPITKKAIGKRMGGGKPNVHHYASPVKAGRIVVEVGGKIEYEEVYPFLNRVAKKMPFDAIPIKHDMLAKLEAEAEEVYRKNINPFSFSYCVENNMQGCNMWTSPWDVVHHGEYI